MASLSPASLPTATGFCTTSPARVCETRAELIPLTSTSGRCRLDAPYSARHLGSHLRSNFLALRSVFCERSNGYRSRKEPYTWQASAASSVESPGITDDLSDVPQPVLVVGATEEDEEELEEWDEEELDELFETYGETVMEDAENEQQMVAEQRDDEESKKFAVAMARAASDGKGADIRVLHVKSLVYWARYFVIISAFSKPQLEAIGKRLRDEAEIDFDRMPMGREREAPNSWTLLDFGDVVVHVFLPTTRSFYALEEFYGNAVPIELPFPQVNME